MKGGGHPFAALAVGSRGVGKRKTLYATTATATNGISVHPEHSPVMRNPTIAGFISPRATQLLAPQNPSASSSPRAHSFSARDRPLYSDHSSQAETGMSGEYSRPAIISEKLE